MVSEALNRTEAPDARQQAFRQCGAAAWVFESLDAPGTFALRGSNCHDRFCKPCARDRSHLIANNLRKHLHAQVFRFLTLTIKGSTNDLTAQVAHLYKSFTKLRRTTLWKDRVTAGVAFCEIKWIGRTNTWHPHLHCLLIGKYLPHDLLKAAWHKATSDSFIVDIRPVRNPETALRYVTKYASKPLSKTFISRPARLDEAIRALRGRRLCTTFGTWRGLKLCDHVDSGEWAPVMSFRNLLQRVSRGDTEARQILSQLERIEQCPSDPVLSKKPRPPPTATTAPSKRPGTRNVQIAASGFTMPQSTSATASSSAQAAANTQTFTPSRLPF